MVISTRDPLKGTDVSVTLDPFKIVILEYPLIVKAAIRGEVNTSPRNPIPTYEDTPTTVYDTSDEDPPVVVNVCVCPPVHVQLLGLATPLVEKLGQNVQVEAPDEEKVLAEHRSGVVVAMGQLSPAGHVRQLLELGLPEEGLYVPAVQLVGLMD